MLRFDTGRLSGQYSAESMVGVLGQGSSVGKVCPLAIIYTQGQALFNQISLFSMFSLMMSINGASIVYI